ncbi:MAG: PBP1A family penicillin-binding protein [Syntrophorhabdus sp.]|nr:PBP1A family penicillin-binding protein [Syntrophorhabdus sp.]
MKKDRKKKRKGSTGKLYKYLLILLIASAALFVSAFIFFIINDIPSVMALKDLKNKPVTSVYDVNDELTYLFVPDNRVFVPYKRIPKHVRAAFLAAEDADFFKHGGVDPMGILRAFIKNVAYGRMAQGGSTITQQVIKSLVLGPEKSLNRKIREAILAYKLENYLSKNEILNLYLNNIYMGHGVYGVEAASEVYFGKHVWNITPAEAALLAGIVQAPSRYTPKKHPGNARMRQEYVIDQMVEKKFITEKTKQQMLKEKVDIREDDGVFADSYYKDHIFRYVEARYGKGVLSRKGLKIYAAVDRRMQKTAEDAIRRGLELYERRKGEYTVLYHMARGKWDDFRRAEERDRKLFPVSKGRTRNLLVSERIKDGYAVFVGEQKAVLKMDTHPFKPGDVVKGLCTGEDKKKAPVFEALRSLKVEGALVSLDVNLGYVYAIVGGRDFEKSPYNRATVAKVQAGSAFKPFIYVTALKKGYTPDSVLHDEPKSYSTGMGRSWTPRNYDGRYSGDISMRDAIAYSKNAATVRLLEEVGIAPVKETIRDIGIEADIENNLSIALGSSNVTLLELVKGFAAFANGGNRIKPLFIRKIVDQNGTVLEENAVQKERALPEDVASSMNILLKGPVQYGTAKGASSIGYPVAGKTGTTSNYYDALFVGYSPHVATGVWVGFDARTSLGKGESGGRVCLPIWMNFMGSVLGRFPGGDFPEVSGAALPGVTGVTGETGTQHNMNTIEGMGR